VTVHHSHGGYRFPEGLPDEPLVTVKSIDIGSAQVLDASVS